MSTIMTDRAIADAIHKVVEEKGEDYIYPGWGATCVYANKDGSPSCLVGHVIAALSPEDFERVVEYENYEIGVEGGGDTDIKSVVSALDLGISERATQALREAQNAQDMGNKWGTALADFDRSIALAGGL